MFLEVYCQVRSKALNLHNIQSAWKKSGLFPFEPDVVLRQLKDQNPRKKTDQALVKNSTNFTNLMNPTNPTNSRPSTAYGPPPLFDLTTPIIEIPLPIQMTLSTPSNVTDLENLRELFQQNQIDQNLLFKKALKAVTYRLSKAVITNAQNDDLVNAAAEAQKRKKEVAGANGRACVRNKKWLAEIARKDFKRYWSALIYGKEHYDKYVTNLALASGLQGLHHVMLGAQLCI
jgi:hypothetical protein